MLVIIFVIAAVMRYNSRNMCVVNSEIFHLGTLISIKLCGSDEKFLNDELKKTEDEIGRLENLFSANIASSDISRVNAANGAWTQISEETASLVDYALRLSQVTHGAFDPSVGRIVKLWGIGTEKARVPAQSEIDNALASCGVKSLKLKRENGKYWLAAQNGVWIDLGAIAKGRVADILKDMLRRDGVTSALINLGGNLYMKGTNGGRPWRVGIQSPGKERGEYFGVVEASDMSVVTSGNYERFFEYNGVRYHHIFNSETGRPAEEDFLSVSVIDKDSAKADALCTALFVMGERAAERFLKENKDTAAVIVYAKNRQVLVTDKAKKYFTLTDSDYAAVEENVK